MTGLAPADGHTQAVGEACRNCGAVLAGAWCHGCGQKADAYHRSARHLVGDAVEDLFHYDGRFRKTVPRLIWRPAQLTRDYLDGKRAAQVPPLRMYVVAFLILLFAWTANQEAIGVRYRLAAPPAAVAAAKVDRAATDAPFVHWLRERARHAIAHPDDVFDAMERMAEISAVLMLPLTALLLGGLFASRPGLYLFDHLIFAMHSLTFVALLLSVVLLASLVTPAATWLLLAIPVHLFAHLSGAYRTSVAGASMRLVGLMLGLVAAFIFILAGLMAVSLATA